MQDELCHIQLAAAGARAAAANSQDTAAATRKLASSVDLRLQVLCRVVATVYGSRFSSEDDQKAVRQLVGCSFDVSESELDKEDASISLQANIPATLRIGAVYMVRGVWGHARARAAPGSAEGLNCGVWWGRVTTVG